MRKVAIHTMDYVDTATTGILSPHVLPVEDLRKMLFVTLCEMASNVNVMMLHFLYLCYAKNAICTLFCDDVSV